MTEFREQQYQCKKCNKKFGISNNPIIKKTINNFYKKIIDKIPEIMKIGYQSLRKNKQILPNIPWNTNISPNNPKLVKPKSRRNNH